MAQADWLEPTEKVDSKMGNAVNDTNINASATGGSVDITVNETIIEKGRQPVNATNIADVNATANGGSVDVTVNQDIVQNSRGREGGPDREKCWGEEKEHVKPEFLSYAEGEKDAKCHDDDLREYKGERRD